MRVWVGQYRASIYREGDGWTGAISLGRSPTGTRRRLKRKASSEKALMRKLVQAVDDLNRGVRADRYYTIERAVTEFLVQLAKQGRAPSTIQAYRGLARHHLIAQLGHIRVQALTADHVEAWLHDRAGHLSSSSLSIVHGLLKRALRRAQRHDKVSRNVAALVDTPHGLPRRRSQAMNVQQAAALLAEAAHGGHRLGAYPVLGLLTGLRTEELRALQWSEVDLEVGAVYVTRAARHTADTKTPRSRRGLALPQGGLAVLRAHRAKQEAERAAAGGNYHDHGLVFCRPDGGPLTGQNVRDDFRVITAAAGLGTVWVPRELRHTFVSILSDHGVTTETIRDLVGHASTHITETVYRHQIRPLVRGGAEAMERVFGGLLHAA
ncbi:tyrosine-type recombinase/integrase [Actinomadura violacea]|uniref:Site-specific integrase n=1 Tax=Actinomadura violacea TaxID=2819934 RepID=A0ABS3RN18_9ACTN|nr:tyrosine-type recombinase/integrase [Actinomadura violacea]MBO2458128.1 site-specific integrase [Actinomadura violacea]